MNPRFAWASRTLLAALPFLALSSQTAIAQTCAIPAPADHEFAPVWGGESWSVFSEQVGNDVHIWVGEDGGRLRVSSDGGSTWTFAVTPLDFTSSILDIWFHPGATHGFAAARGGRLLETVDGGATWTDFSNNTILDGFGLPATIWGVRALDNGDVIISGDWLLAVSRNNGTTWSPINIWDRYPALPGATQLLQRRFTLFRLDLIGDSNAFTASVGAKWEGLPGEVGWPAPADGKAHGVLLNTNTNLAGSNMGDDWWISLDDGPLLPGNAPSMVEPWAVRFAAGSTSLQTSLGFAVGGRGGNHPSRYYVTQNSGRSWTLDGNAAVTMYDVSARLNGEAVIAGYSGNYVLRDSGTGAWTTHVMTSSSTDFPTPGQATGAFGGSSLFGDDGMLLVGDFGQQRVSIDDGQTWNSMSPFYPASNELELRIYDTAFQATAPQIGYMVGQHGQVYRTPNSGCDWTLVRPDDGIRLNAIDVEDLGPAIAVGQNGTVTYSPTPSQPWLNGSLPVNSVPPAASIAFKDVNFSGPGEAWAVGEGNGTPVLAYTNSGGATWQLANIPSLSNLKLNAVAFSSTTEGLVVGSVKIGGVVKPVAFHVTFTGTNLLWSNLNVDLLGYNGELLDVAIGSGPLANAKAVAVGSNGLVFEWNGTTFVISGGNSLLPFDLRNVDVSPSNGTVLIGGVYDNNPVTSASKGRLVRYDATGGWHTVRGLLGKDITGISLTSDSAGFVAGQTGPGSSSFVNGNLASSILLHYDAN